MREDFAVFICTHGRPYAQHTLKKLLSTGYTGKYYLVLDDQDDTIQSYIDEYGADNIIVFDKNHYINSMDVGSSNPPYKCIVYAKNACEDIARDMGLSVFVIADDDVVSFRYRWPEDNVLKSMEVKSNIDEILDAYCDALLTMNISTASFGVPSHYFLGVSSITNEKVQSMRIPFQFVFRNTAHKVDWISGFGEDIITAVRYNQLGQFWQVLPQVELSTLPLATGSGGMLDTYKSLSSFTRAMYNFIFSPTGIKFYQNKDGMFKPAIRYGSTTPKVVSPKFRKD